MNNKRFFAVFIGAFLLLMVTVAGVTIYIDPFFHYHAPLKQYAYPLNNPRYQNDGITRYFEYDTIVTGTSMVEPFSISYLNQAFGVNAIKVCYSGAAFKEIDETIKRGIERNPKVKMVIRGLDYQSLTVDKDFEKYDNLPTYLYNENPFDDVSYIFNKEVLLFRTIGVMEFTQNGGVTTTFDQYSLPNDPYGKEYALSYYERPKKIKKKEKTLSEDAKKREVENLKQNVSETIIENPDVEFYLFFCPYSILYWDKIYRSGELKQHIEKERIAIEELLQYENVHLFSFDTDTEFNTRLEHFRDTTHYDQYSTAFLIDYLATGKYELTKENYETYLEEVYNLYKNYDYDKIFVE